MTTYLHGNKESINQQQGPRTGNPGSSTKVSEFHGKHAYAKTLATAVGNKYNMSPTEGEYVAENRHGSINEGRAMPR